jgi:hypothetical protein
MITGSTGAAVGMSASAADVSCGVTDLDAGSNCHAGVNDRVGDSKGAKEGKGGGIVGRGVDNADTSGPWNGQVLRGYMPTLFMAGQYLR